MCMLFMYLFWYILLSAFGIRRKKTLNGPIAIKATSLYENMEVHEYVFQEITTNVSAGPVIGWYHF